MPKTPPTQKNHRRAWILALSLALTGCKTYTAIPYDGGDGSAPDGGSDIQSMVDSAQDISSSVCADAGACKILPPRLIAPLSTATVTSRKPTLRWIPAEAGNGAHVQICRDRACTMEIVAFDVSGASGAPPADLPIGVVFWRVYGRSAGTTGDQSTPTWQFTVGARSAAIQASWGTTLDVNGDGYADIVVGASGADRAYVYLGGASGLSSAQQPTILIGPDGQGAGFGGSVASTGDVNGDGYADVIVGAISAANATGRAYLYLGGASGVSSSQQPIALTGPDGASGSFGSSVASAGDVNGDGYADVVVGASGAMTNTGRAYVYFGSASGLSSTQQAAALTGPDGANGIFGISVAGAGDVNGDGYADLIVGAWRVMTNTGRAYVYLGAASGLSSTQQPVVLTGRDGTEGNFGISVAGIGDVNGDGYSDIAVGASGVMTATGRVYVYMGSASGLSSTQQPMTLAGDGENLQFGASVAGAGDVNGDGFADLVVGATQFMNSTGRAYVYFGGLASLLNQLPVILTGPDGSAGAFGKSVAGAGDVNGDTYADVVVGAFGVMTVTGRAYIYVGSSSGPDATRQPIVFTGPDGAAGFFGYSVAAAGHSNRMNRIGSTGPRWGWPISRQTQRSTIQ